MKICIIGSGVSGIQTAYYFSKEEHECFVFDSKPEPGGVWQQNYDGYALQVPSELYEFENFPFNHGQFPSGKQVLQYINKFIEKHDLYRKCTFLLNETVLSINQNDKGKWNVNTSKNNYDFDYCIICTGMYNCPNIPKELLKYDPIHSSDFVNASVSKDKRVYVVGGGKSAIDCAVAASKHTNDVTILMRELHWPVPRYILNIIPFKWGTYSRLGHFLLPKHWKINEKENYWHDKIQPLKTIIWKLLEKIFKFQFNLHETPSNSLQVDLFGGGQILNYDFRDRVENKSIIIMKTSNTDCINHGDMVICGTGFKKDYSIFSENIIDKLHVESDGLWLYKNIIPENVDNLAFIGSEVSTFNNILTQSLQAQWLVKMLKDSTLPSKNIMSEYVSCEKTWKRSWMPESSSRASLIQLHMTKYHDELYADIHNKIVKNKWWQWFIPLTAKDYTV